MRDKVIHFLRKYDGYVSGEEMSGTLHISRAAIWKYMQELRKDGYDIVAVPHLGYKLVSVPDKLFPPELQEGLKTKILGKKIFYQETVSSTMDVAFQMAVQGAPEGTVVCAENQTKGRGRLGRAWSSPKGKGIYMSIILRPQLPPSEVAKLTLLSAVALCEAIESETSLHPRIKWPNDLLIKNKKLAGILTELSAEVDKVKFVVMGIGINVNTSPGALPEGGTSLKNESGQSYSRIQMTQSILTAIEEWYGRLSREGFTPVVERWKELSLTLGKRVRISDPAGKVEGEAIDLDTDGGLLIREDSGLITKRMAGDVLLAH